MPAPRVQTGVATSTDHNALAQYVDDSRTGILARGRRTTSSSSTTTEVGVLRLDDIPIWGGFLYHIFTSIIPINSTVTGDTMFARIRYTTDGSTPTTSSTILPGAEMQCRENDSSWHETKIIVTHYTPVVDETLSLLLTVGRLNGTGSVQSVGSAVTVVDLRVDSNGVDPGDIGVDI